VKIGYARAYVWANQTEHGVQFNVSVCRYYKGDDDKWYPSTTFGHTHLLALAKCVDQAHTWICAQLTGDVPV
jgi:hypothetical protein